MDWKAYAEKMYFEGSSINDIAAEIEKSRQAVSGYLKSLPGFKEEKERRKMENREKRREYKRVKNKQYRIPMEITADTIKREHDIAVMLLSHERY